MKTYKVILVKGSGQVEVFVHAQDLIHARDKVFNMAELFGCAKFDIKEVSHG